MHSASSAAVAAIAVFKQDFFTQSCICVRYSHNRVCEPSSTKVETRYRDTARSQIHSVRLIKSINGADVVCASHAFPRVNVFVLAGCNPVGGFEPTGDQCLHAFEGGFFDQSTRQRERGARATRGTPLRLPNVSIMAEGVFRHAGMVVGKLGSKYAPMILDGD